MPKPHPCGPAALALSFLCGCGSDTGSAPSSPRLSLVEAFGSASVAGGVEPTTPVRPLEWRFDYAEGVEQATGGWSALHGVEDLRVEEGRLVGRTGEVPLIAVPLPEELGAEGQLHAIELRLRASAGTKLGAFLVQDEELDEELVGELVESLADGGTADLTVDFEPGEEWQDVTLDSADSAFAYAYSLAATRYLVLMPTDEADARFELESLRLVSRREHLATIPSGIGWHGQAEVYRESIVARSPERITFALELPAAPYLELAIATIEGRPVTFVVEAREDGGGWTTLLKRTVSTPDRWNDARVELAPLASRRVELRLGLDAEEPGAIGFWGGPVVRSRGARPAVAPASPALRALAGDDPAPPRGVIVILADTLRRDHLPMYGHDRDNAPTLERLAREGALFEDAISQGAWTKVAATSLLTGLYGTTHGLSDMSDRLSASVTTLAEAFRGAGYATFATSSVPFTGKLSNLHQGVDVLYERGSIEGSFLAAKTARPFADHLLAWLESVRDVPFFALYHVFDPHSPFEPDEPWSSRWMEPAVLAEHREDMERVKEVIESDFMKNQALPDAEEMAASGVDAATYVEREKIWYDASIRAMDVEVARLIERLDELGLAEDTLIAVVSDHGEEFLEHGRHFHGYTAYGEMLNVPLLLWWPGVVPAGARVSRAVETIGLMPTLLGLSRIPVPAAAQGQDLLPLLVPGREPESLGWSPRPVFSERRIAPRAFDDDKRPVTSLVVVDRPWKLVWNTERPDDWPEYELYDHEADPLNLADVAPENPDVVEALAERLRTWSEEAEAARGELGESLEELDEEALDHLRALGYAE